MLYVMNLMLKFVFENSVSFGLCCIVLRLVGCGNIDIWYLLVMSFCKCVVGLGVIVNMRCVSFMLFGF